MTSQADTHSSSDKDAVSSNDWSLFIASFMALIAAGIGFSVRGAILGDWAAQYGFTQSELGTITGGGLTGFGLTIIVLSFVADKIGYGPLMVLGFLLHLSSAIVTFFATTIFDQYGKEGAFWCLNIGMWLFALGNGTCEAVINPLTATLFPKSKTHWLNILHAGWPGGLILGALLGVLFEKIGNVRWEIQLATFLVPTLIYGFLMFGKKFPKSEASVSGVEIGTMLAQFAAPVLLFLVFLHALVGYVELGTDSWITNITGRILESKTAGLYLFIWTSGLMFVLRFFAGPIVHRINPLGLLFISAVFGTIGLYLLGTTTTLAMCVVAATIYGLGKTFYWPTMLGVASERFPKGGALVLGIMGGVGMLSAGLLGGPIIGYKQDYFTTQKLDETNKAAYDRFKVAKPGAPYGFLPAIAGIDGSKFAVLEDYEKNKDKPEAKLTIEKDLERVKSGGDPEKNKALIKELTELNDWWNKEEKPNATADLKDVVAARLTGGQKALLVTAFVPATMAIGYLLLILYFRATGGYKQEHIDH